MNLFIDSNVPEEITKNRVPIWEGMYKNQCCCDIVTIPCAIFEYAKCDKV